MNHLTDAEKNKVGKLMMTIQEAQLQFDVKEADAKYLAYAFIICGIMASRFSGMTKEEAENHFAEVAATFVSKNQPTH